MTQDEIIRMAREAGFHIENWSFGERVSVYESGKTIDITNELKDFVALVAAHEREKVLSNDESLTLAHDVGYRKGQIAEREACAKVCDARTGEPGWCCADAIRARGEK